MSKPIQYLELYETLVFTSGMLSRIDTALQRRRNLVNAVAEGTLTLTSEQRETIKALHKEVVDRIGALSFEFLSDAQRRVVTSDRHDVRHDTSDALTRPPARFMDAYESLVIATYGSIGTGALSNSVEKGKLGKSDGKPVEWRVSSGVESTGRTAGGPKKIGAGKNIIKNEKMYREKVKVDKRIRKLATEVEVILGQGSMPADQKVCSKCHKMGESDWGFCPRCGGSMKRVD